MQSVILFKENIMSDYEYWKIADYSETVIVNDNLCTEHIKPAAYFPGQ